MARSAAAKVEKLDTAPPATEATGDHPWHKARLGAMQTGMWANHYTSKEGDEIVSNMLTLKRSYTDKDGEWQETKIQLRDRDIGPAIALLQNAQQQLIKEG